MKKLFLSLIAVAVGTLSSFAQSDLVATLSHGSSLSTYSGEDALANAYEAAVDGDIITLSPGTFIGVDMNKAITIRGIGYKPMENNDYQSTKISGEMTIEVPSGAASPFEMEGLDVLDDVAIYGNEQPIVIMGKCRFKSVVAAGISMNMVSCINGFVSALIYKGSYNYGEHLNTTIYCYNCVIASVRASGFDTNYKKTAKIIATNCIVGDDSNNVGSELYNCIITCNGHALSETCIAKNCIGINLNSGPSVFDNNYDSSNIMIEGQGEVAFRKVFTTATSISAGLDSYQETYELTETAAATYLGEDGTQVGIYGGAHPFNLTPTIPQVTNFTVNSTTVGDQLKVKINVE